MSLNASRVAANSVIRVSHTTHQIRTLVLPKRGMAMSEAKRNRIPLFVYCGTEANYGKLYATLFFCGFVLSQGCGFKFEESASRVSVVVEWPKEDEIESVSVRTFTKHWMARAYLQDGHLTPREKLQTPLSISNGESCYLTLLHSNFDSKRLLQTCIVMEYKNIAWDSEVREIRCFTPDEFVESEIRIVVGEGEFVPVGDKKGQSGENKGGENNALEKIKVSGTEKAD